MSIDPPDRAGGASPLPGQLGRLLGRAVCLAASAAVLFGLWLPGAAIPESYRHATPVQPGVGAQALFAAVLLLLLLSPWLTTRACRRVTECPSPLARTLTLLAPALLFVSVAVPAYYYASLFSLVRLAWPRTWFWPGVAGAAMYGMAVARRTRWGSGLVGLLFGAGAVALAFTAQRFPRFHWNSETSYVLDVEQLLARLPFVLVLGVAAAGVALVARARLLPPRLHTATVIVVPGLTVAAAFLVLQPFSFPRTWSPDQVGHVRVARINDRGDLALVAEAQWLGENTHYAGALLRRAGSARFERITTRSAEPMRFSPDGRRVAYVENPLLLKVWRKQRTLVMLKDIDSGEVESLLEPPSPRHLPPPSADEVKLGPGRAWACGRDGVHGRLVSGRPFELPRTGGRLWITGNLLVVAVIEGAKMPDTRHNRIVRMDLRSGEASTVALPSGLSGVASVSPSGQHFVGATVVDLRVPDEFHRIDLEGHCELLGEASLGGGEGGALYWRADDDVGTIPTKTLGGLTGIKLYPYKKGAWVWDDRVHEVAGCLLAWDKSSGTGSSSAKLFQIDPSLQRAYLLHEHVRDIQWMRDSVLVVHEAFPATRVARTWPATGRFEVLLAQRWNPITKRYAFEATPDPSAPWP